MSLKLYIPRDAAAKALGANEVVAAVRAEAAKRGVDVTIVRNGSRGMVWLEPLVEVERADGRHAFGPVAASDVASLFDANWGSHALAQGLTEEIPFFKSQTRLTFARCGKIDPLSLEDYAAHGGLTGLKRALGMAGAAIVQEVTDSGLRGRGGAGFPTGIKWKTVADAKADQKYIVVNADEGDSATFADRMIMEGDPFTLIEGMVIAGIAVGATKGYVYIRSEYPDAVEVTKAAYPDPTDETGKFVCVDVKAKEAFATPVTLAAIKAEKKLAEMVLVKNSRLSVQPVTDAEWAIVAKMGGVKE